MEQLTLQDQRVESLRAESSISSERDRDLLALREERDQLLHDRAAAARRVEAILQRLAALGLD